ncbi:MAG: MarR family winged helix-turn-helix transcriptional regulator [Beijerinckiaceae bacterium]
MPRLKRAPAPTTGGGSPQDAGQLFVHTMPGHYIRRVQQVAVRLFSEGVSGDITPVQFAALSALADAPGQGQAALASAIGYDRATIGGVIDRLETKGFVSRVADPGDRRSNILNLTKAGAAALETARPQVEAVQEKLLAPLSESERAQYRAMCRKILAANGG